MVGILLLVPSRLLEVVVVLTIVEVVVLVVLVAEEPAEAVVEAQVAPVQE
tara:strand:- start:411 stop:560 length:150 start_codon:yes stop_codon:yes gene_type:complete